MSGIQKSDRLFQIAENQQGYFTSADAKRLGYDYPHQHFHVKQGNWIRVDHGIYRLKKFPAAGHEDLIRWWLWSRKKGVVSHESAAAVYDLGNLLPSGVHLTVPPDLRKRPPEGVTLHKTKLLASDVEIREGLPMTSPLRTIADLALAHIDPERLSAIVKDAVRKGLVEKRELLTLSSKLSEPAKRAAQQALDQVFLAAPRVREKTEEWNQNTAEMQGLLLEIKAELQAIYRKLKADNISTF